MPQRRISIIDLSDFDNRKSEIRKALLHAAEVEGVFYVNNHGISQHLIDEMFAQAKTFFQHDEAVKQAYSFDKPRNAGWESKAQHHDVLKTDCQQTLRCLHYHDTKELHAPADYWRAGAHTDFDTLTLLFQRPGEKGLEICPGREAVSEFGVNDDWSAADPIPGAITCNIGDMLMQWSDDRLKSTFHRVRMPKADEYQGPRYSIGYFNQANKGSVILGPKKKYPPVTGLDFILAAMQRNYNALEALKQHNGGGNMVPCTT